MAKPLVFQFGDRDISFSLEKVDRSELYGYKETEALDASGHVCELATLASDGQTLISQGGTGLGHITSRGEWYEKSELKPIDLDGNEITPVASSYSAPIQLFETVTPDRYLSHNVRSLYRLTTKDEIGDLLAELKRGTIFSFPYSYRGGLEADAGFMLLGDDRNVFFAAGEPAKIEFIGIQTSIAEFDGTEEDSEKELMDFDMI